MKNIFFTADPHFFHKNIIKFCNRPFEHLHEMHETIISRWNEFVRKSDLVYTLGDWGFGSPGMLQQIRNRLNGEILFIRGSHDRNAIRAFGEIPYVREITIDGQFIVLCHYAMRTWHKSHYNSWQLYGHSHGQLGSQGKSFDVGVDSWNFYPVSFDQIKDRMDNQPDNINYIGSRK